MGPSARTLGPMTTPGPDQLPDDELALEATPDQLNPYTGDTTVAQEVMP